MLCGSTEHLLKKTATAGRIGSGTGWLHNLILVINDSDARGDTEIPNDLMWQVLAVPRINRPDQVARWVFDMMAEHHAPRRRARAQGLARGMSISLRGSGFRDWSWPLPCTLGSFEETDAMDHTTEASPRFVPLVWGPLWKCTVIFPQGSVTGTTSHPSNPERSALLGVSRPAHC